jgi:hypothetical protein
MGAAHEGGIISANRFRCIQKRGQVVLYPDSRLFQACLALQDHYKAEGALAGKVNS